jgi:hypothetical protein
VDTIVPDPHSPINWNRYNYAESNPINFTDPLGHKAEPGTGDGGGKYKPLPPVIVTRSEWGARPSGSVSPVPGAEMDETPYSSDNKYGYASYSESNPPQSLSEILDTVVIHHEGDDVTFDILDLQRIEMERGFWDLPYHYIIAPDGTIYEGRPIEIRGAHVEGLNTGKVGVLWMGDFNPGDERYPGQVDLTDAIPTMDQFTSTVRLTNWLDDLYGIDFVGGHSDFNATACPGANAKTFVDVLKGLFN